MGNLWVRNYRWFDIGGNRAWTVFNREGRHLGDVVTPSRLEIHQIGDDFVPGRMADGRGAEAVYVFPLEKPDARRMGTTAPAGNDGSATAPARRSR